MNKIPVNQDKTSQHFFPIGTNTDAMIDGQEPEINATKSLSQRKVKFDDKYETRAAPERREPDEERLMIPPHAQSHGRLQSQKICSQIAHQAKSNECFRLHVEIKIDQIEKPEYKKLIFQKIPRKLL